MSLLLRQYKDCDDIFTKGWVQIFLSEGKVGYNASCCIGIYNLNGHKVKDSIQLSNIDHKKRNGVVTNFISPW